jgi:hypothetical protein
MTLSANVRKSLITTEAACTCERHYEIISILLPNVYCVCSCCFPLEREDDLDFSSEDGSIRHHRNGQSIPVALAFQTMLRLASIKYSFTRPSVAYLFKMRLNIAISYLINLCTHLPSFLPLHLILLAHKPRILLESSM